MYFGAVMRKTEQKLGMETLQETDGERLWFLGSPKSSEIYARIFFPVRAACLAYLELHGHISRSSTGLWISYISLGLLGDSDTHWILSVFLVIDKF